MHRRKIRNNENWIQSENLSEKWHGLEQASRHSICLCVCVSVGVKIATALTLIIAFDEMRNIVARSLISFVLFTRSSPLSNSTRVLCRARPCLEIRSLHVRRFSKHADRSAMAAFSSWLGTECTFLSSSSSSISMARLKNSVKCKQHILIWCFRGAFATATVLCRSSARSRRTTSA